MIFNKYSVQTKVVKNKDQTTLDGAAAKTFADHAQIVRETAEVLGTKALIAVVAYVAADTVRKVIVKSTPTK